LILGLTGVELFESAAHGFDTRLHREKLLDVRFGEIEHRMHCTRRGFLGAIAAFPAAFRLTAAEPLSIDLGYRQMYNLQFDDAHRTFAEWRRTNPGDPLGPASDAAAYLFTELDRLRVLESEFFVSDQRFFGTRPAPDPAVKRKFESALSDTEALASRSLTRNASDADALFANLMRHGLRADYLGLVEKSNLAALRETVAGRSAAEKLLNVRPDYYDAYVAIGVENYLLSFKAAPLRWLLRIGGAQTYKFYMDSYFFHKGKTYYWKIRARNASGNWGPWSDIHSFTPM